MSRYSIFTFQFYPIDLSEPCLPGMVINVDENYSRKNEILDGILSGQLSFMLKKQVYPHQIVYLENRILIMQLAHCGYIMQESDFSRKKLPNSPSCFIIIDNRDNKQRVYIEDRTVAFQDPRFAASILEQTFNRQLKQYGLSLAITGEFESSEFWRFAKDHVGKIKMLRFSFPYPNLPRVTNQIDQAIIQAGLSVNSKETKLELNAGKNESLDIKKSNKRLKNLVKASSESGSPIICSTGTKRKHTTIGNALRTIDIDIEETLTPNLLESVYEKLKKLLKD